MDFFFSFRNGGSGLRATIIDMSKDAHNTLYKLTVHKYKLPVEMHNILHILLKHTTRCYAASVPSISVKYSLLTS